MGGERTTLKNASNATAKSTFEIFTCLAVFLRVVDDDGVSPSTAVAESVPEAVGGTFGRKE